MDASELQPITLYGSNISYFTGKLENYFRVKGIPYVFHTVRFPGDMATIKKNLGVSQIPALELADGRWMTDTTRIIQWFETQFPDNPVIPQDPLQAFLCLLLEDYADEWLWRPAMHYRWHYPEGAHHLSRHIVDELLPGVPLPGPLVRWFFRYRQRSGYTSGDGITRDAVAGVEQIYLRTLQQLQGIFEQRPYVLGERPSLADIGFSGPFFRHFGLDPVAQEIMRQQAPAVFEWVARLWNTRMDDCKGEWVKGVPADLGPLLDEIGGHYLPYLCANVEAVENGSKRFDAEIGGVAYRGARYSRYRVWCLQELRAHYEALPEDTQLPTPVRHALKAERIGVAVVSIDGFECAGHPGEEDVTGLVLIPAAVQRLKIPVVASGGFADGRGLAAALALGADGINMGTRFIVTEEAPVHENIKQKIVEMDETQTSLIFRSFRNTARVYTNSVAKQVAEIEKSGGDFGQVHHLVSGKMQDVAWETGDIDAGMITVGMCVGLINDIPSCKQLVQNIVTDAEQIISERLASMVAG